MLASKSALLCTILWQTVSSYMYDSTYQAFPNYIGEQDIGHPDYYEHFSPYQDYHLEGRSEMNVFGCGYEKVGYFKDYKTCGVYYECLVVNGTWWRMQFQCPKSQSYDESLQNCVDSPSCSESIKFPNNRKGLICTRDYEMHQDPENCSNYYICHDTGPYYTLEFKTCNKVSLFTNKTIVKFFNEERQNCFFPSDSKGVCPQWWKPRPDNWTCKEGEFQPSPDNCRKYYKCDRKRKFILEMECEIGTHFNGNGKYPGCQPGRCNWVVPVDHHCGFKPPKSYRVVDKCRSYVSCYKCQDNVQQICWDGIENCGIDEIFDDQTLQCVKATKCPGEDAISTGMHCESTGQTNVHPYDCKKYYECKPCFNNVGWCVEISTCPEGQYYDDYAKTCLGVLQCPQEYDPVPTEQGWTQCHQKGERNSIPGNCAQFYVCNPCNKSGGWCYIPYDCPEGEFFNSRKKICVPTLACPQEEIQLPKDWNCYYDARATAMPGNCTNYIICYPCQNSKGRCYVADSCPPGKIFNDEASSGRCEYGRCDYWPELLPHNWRCDKVGDVHVLPSNCHRYYMCQPCPDNHEWCYEEGLCEVNQFFDETWGKCVDSYVCPQDLKEIGDRPEWDCSFEGQQNVLPGDCSKYYECLRCRKPKKWCYYKPISCLEGSNFDQLKKECTIGTCPQTRPEIPDGWGCEIDGEEHVVPDDCTKYYRCSRCGKPKGWCYDKEGCPYGHTYDNFNKMCVPGRCPQLDPILPDGWKCQEDGELNVVPNDCSSYYICKSCNNGAWCYKDEIVNCPMNQTFNDTLKRCQYGRCPQYPPFLPEAWDCEYIGQRNVHPLDCSSFYTCIECPDIASLCYTVTKCEDGQTYDEKLQLCVNEPRCRQWPPLLPPGWKCNFHGERNVHPEDCTKYYTCVIFQNEMTYNEETCEPGHYFDNAQKQCVMAQRCPQDAPELPKGWTCVNDGEKHQHPDDCSQYYTCVRVEVSTKGRSRRKVRDIEKRSILKNFLKKRDAEPNTNVSAAVLVTNETLPENQNNTVEAPSGDLNSTNVTTSSTEKPAVGERSFGDNKNKYWSYNITKCPKGDNFNEAAGVCQPGPCAQNAQPLPPGWICAKDGELMVHPNDCSLYYKCIWYGNSWSYVLMKCQSGYNFDHNNKYCIKGECPQQYPSLPKGWICKKDGRKEQHPQDCSQYFTCAVCWGGTVTNQGSGGGIGIGIGIGIIGIIGIGNNRCASGGGFIEIVVGIGAGQNQNECGWCYKDVKKCRRGYMFDDWRQQCTERTSCPNDKKGRAMMADYTVGDGESEYW